ncbi:MAG: c-type cytochrome [Panacagrimonas sp.]
MSRVRVVTMLLALCAAGASRAADTLTLSCPVCHGTGQTGMHIPSMRGHSVESLQTLLREFRDGTRAGTAMPRLAKSLSDAEIRRLAEFYGEARP